MEGATGFSPAAAALRGCRENYGLQRVEAVEKIRRSLVAPPSAAVEGAAGCAGPGPPLAGLVDRDKLLVAAAEAEAAGYHAEAAAGTFLRLGAEPFDAADVLGDQQPVEDCADVPEAPWSLLSLEPDTDQPGDAELDPLDEGGDSVATGGGGAGGGAARRPSQDLTAVTGALVAMGIDYMSTHSGGDQNWADGAGNRRGCGGEAGLRRCRHGGCCRTEHTLRWRRGWSWGWSCRGWRGRRRQPEQPTGGPGAAGLGAGAVQQCLEGVQ
eukprot:SAG22_NODE_2217_length_2823_cov_1.554495_2_plen_268_part_00